MLHLLLLLSTSQVFVSWLPLFLAINFNVTFLLFAEYNHSRPSGSRPWTVCSRQGSSVLSCCARLDSSTSFPAGIGCW
ncbi:hypothetical protein BDV96DRAFT_592097 [Lophiotrema nucula]|uniref:Uncharacterized protein n=1 Tax=Lophiotrema nucula TaxID=690887 RepID=A0A6A5YG92_9PLEO|nr:hypothetical protein BDV96DRAFT_592097 [Lophiotrema nucula]